MKRRLRPCGYWVTRQPCEVVAVTSTSRCTLAGRGTTVQPDYRVAPLAPIFLTPRMKEWQHLWDKPVLDEMDLHKRECVAYLSRKEDGCSEGKLVQGFSFELWKFEAAFIFRIVLMLWRTTISFLLQPINTICFNYLGLYFNHCACLCTCMPAPHHWIIPVKTISLMTQTPPTVGMIDSSGKVQTPRSRSSPKYSCCCMRE